ncbi:MAG: aminotransferase class V-fold PLP-dependent enzyme [Bacillota bacterium]|jgi:cysteine desulfurase/selenocysteine lyase
MIYFDNAATTFLKPPQVIEKVTECLINYGANPGRSGHKLALKASNEVYRTRELVAQFFHISDPLRVIFTSNGTDSLNLALKGCLKPGDHVITTAMEHNSVLRPLSALKEKGVLVSIVPCDPNGILDIELIKKEIHPKTKMIAVIHASNLIGTINPIEEIGKICREKGLVFLVDAAQSAGVYDIDVERMNIDLLAVPGHKSLFGIQGTGILYVGKGVDLEELKQGGTGSKSEDIFQPKIFPDQYESGTLNLPGIVSLGSGIEYINQVGIEEIREHEGALARLLLEELLNIKGVIVYGEKSMARRAPVIAINIAGMDSSELAFELDVQFQICTRAGIHCAPLAHKTIGTLELGAVRLSLGYFNTKEEVLITAAAIQKIAKENG